MSLLMKALEKAAQDRHKTTDQSAATSASGTTGGKTALSLEPVVPAAAPARSEPAFNTRSTGSAARAAPNTGAPGAVGSAPRTPVRNDQARAAVLLSARQPARSGNIGAWISAHPVPFAAALAGLIAIGYAIYLYLQIMHPALFLRAPAAPSQPIAALAPVATPAPEPSSPTPTAPTTDAAGAPSPPSALIPAQSVFSSRSVASAPSLPESNPAPVNSGALIPPKAATPTPARAATPVAPVVPSPAVSPANKIVVSRGDNTAPRIHSAVSEAYAALEAGRLDTARQHYEQALRGEPNNIDALLGLAAIARHENRTDDAAKYYLRILDTDPRHALAQTGLIALLGRADPQAAESRLKQLAAREPSPALYFTLGNLYADQGQWSQAQQAYFQAHHLDAGNPDYAYNLAVSLEHISQPKLALGFYRRAVQLAAGRGRANFNAAQAEARITKLAARAE